MDQFQVHRISNTADQYFDEFWRIYTASFPLNERRTLEQQTDIFKKSNCRLDVYIYENKLIGFLSFWTATEFIFIEHLAIAAEYRNRGLGKQILKPFLKQNLKPVILEIELPIDSSTRQRLHFYESLGFKLNEHKHSQPPYHQGEESIPMKILSYKEVISEKSYQQFSRFQNEIVVG